MVLSTDLEAAFRPSAGRAVAGLVAAAVAGIAAGREGLAAVRHPLGFVCLPLERLADRGVCVHLWSGGPPSRLLTTSAVHCHSWDLRSGVLYGVIDNELVAVEESPPVPTHRLFEVRSHEDGDELHRTARVVRYTPLGPRRHGPGETYELPAGAFHLNHSPDRQPAATVVLARYHPEAPDLSLGGLDTESHRVVRSRCSPAETALAARTLLRALNADGVLRSR
jgi:hypothetical protein